MSPDEAPNPFQRGTGSYPPVLAGRQAELTALRRLLSGLANGTLEQTIHLMQAPRGLGKTVLLQALQRDAAVRVEGVDVRRTSAGVFTDIDDLAQLIEPAQSLPRRLLNWFAGANALGIRLERPTGGGGKTLRMIERALEQRSRRPLLLAVDEAHVLPPSVCRALLNAFHATDTKGSVATDGGCCMEGRSGLGPEAGPVPSEREVPDTAMGRFQNATGKARCALLLVGTPALTPLLLSQEVNASFAERAPAIMPGLLSLDESIEALHVPQWREWEVEEPVLAEVAADCLGYPFFLQLWGEQLWEAGRSRRAVDAQAFHAARTGVDAVRTDFYAARFDEFERFGMVEGVGRAALLAAVQRIAPEISEWKAAITTLRLNQAMEDLGLNESQVAAAKRCFIDNGFLTRHGDDWQAAIPSLATYIREHPR